MPEPLVFHQYLCKECNRRWSLEAPAALCPGCGCALTPLTRIRGEVKGPEGKGGEPS